MEVREEGMKVEKECIKYWVNEGVKKKIYIDLLT